MASVRRVVDRGAGGGRRPGRGVLRRRGRDSRRPGLSHGRRPDPAPTPASGGESASANSCPIGKGNPDAACAKGSPQLLAAVESAIDRLVRERPELFNLQEESVAGTGQYRVLDKEAYLEGVIANLRAAGMCAGRSLDLERVQVKSTNAASEEFDIWTSSGFVRRGGAAYRQTCTPAAFPLEARARSSPTCACVLWGFDCNPGVIAPAPAGGPGAARAATASRPPPRSRRTGRTCRPGSTAPTSTGSCARATTWSRSSPTRPT